MQEIAQECRIPCVYLVDSGGANLPRQVAYSRRPCLESKGALPKPIGQVPTMIGQGP